MRGTFLIISALLAIALATGAYVVISGHGPVPIRRPDDKPKDEATSQNISTTGPAFKQAEGVWYTRIDKFGNPTSQWRFARSDPPMKDGRVKLYNPEIIFYLAKGQTLSTRGSTAIITMQEVGGHGRSQVGNTSIAQQPRSGKCYDVTLEMSSKDPNAQKVRVTMNNLAFDNDSMRFVTEAYDDGKGRMVPADEVPVHVRGEDYEFDGYGLTLQYNDVDRRLENLTIARGERLLIKNPRKYLESRSTTRPAVSQSGDPMADAICALTPALSRSTGRGSIGAPPLWRKGEPLAGIELVAADPGAARDAARPAAAKRAPVQRTTTRPVARPGAEDQVYRATFSNVVEIFQDNKKMATADRMELLFVSQEGNSPTTQPSADKPARGVSDAASDSATVNDGKRGSTTRPSARDQSASAPSAAAQPGAGKTTGSASATQPTNPLDLPVEIRWKGPMKIEPVTGEKPEGLIAGQAIVKLIASPGKMIHVVRDSNSGGKNNLKCATLTYWTVDHRLLLESSRGSVIEMYEERENKVVNRITSDFMDVAQDDGTALLGPGKASIAAEVEERQEGASKEPMTVSWNDRCNLYFIPGAGDQMIVKRAELDGKVKVNQPNQLVMDADSLDLFFDTTAQESKTTTRPARNSAPPLSKLRASGSVKCNVTGPGGPSDLHDIKCDNLDLLTARAADGRLYAHTIVATGNVDIDDAERNVQAGLVSASLGEPTTRPTTKPSKVNTMPGNLERLIANNSVHILTKKDKNTADCDTLEIHKADGQTTAILMTMGGDKKSRITWGNDPSNKNQQGSLTGSMIRMVQETEEVTVEGPGQLDAKYLPEGQPQDKPVPVHVQWSERLYAHGDVIDCVGIPRDADGNEMDMIQSRDTDGAVNTARAQTITLTTTRPTTRPANKSVAGAGSTTKPSGELNVMANRAIRSIELKGIGAPATVKSVLETPDGARVFVAEATPSKGVATPALIQFFQPSEAERRLVIPGPGTLKFADTRPPRDNAAARESADDPMGMRGNMAFAWTRSLVYDRLQKQIEMLGDVQVSRLDNKPDAKPIRLYGNKLIVVVDEPPATTTRPATTHPATTQPGGLGFMSSRIEIKHIHAEGTENPRVPLTIKSGNLHVRAPLLDFDPAKHELVLHGTADNPVLELDPDGIVRSTCEDFRYNTLTEKVTFRKFVGTLNK